MTVYKKPETHYTKGLFAFFNLDTTLVMLLAGICTFGLVVLYSASRQSMDLVFNQSIRMGIGFFVMMFLAYIPPQLLKKITPWLFMIGLFLCLLIFVKIGDRYLLSVEVNGSRRWLDFKFMRFQPSEIMKLAVPMMVAYFLDRRTLPPNFLTILIALLICFFPFVTILKQPDLGTSLLVIFPALCVIFLAGLNLRYIFGTLAIIAIGAKPFWDYILKEYQKQRILTLLDPESNPLSSGYHIIQSKIAIGSGGLYGKGWLNGTQANLQFLPESTTDFIYAVVAEEFGLIGLSMLIGVYFLIIIRSFMISKQGIDIFSKLLGGAITMSFFFYVFINAGMVSGILPVVGLPLPFISYGGTSVVTLFAAFGVLMSIYSHRKIIPKKKPNDFD